MGHEKKDGLPQKQGSFNNIKSGNSTSLFKHKNKKNANHRESSLQHVRPNQDS